MSLPECTPAHLRTCASRLGIDPFSVRRFSRPRLGSGHVPRVASSASKIRSYAAKCIIQKCKFEMRVGRGKMNEITLSVWQAEQLPNWSMKRTFIPAPAFAGPGASSDWNSKPAPNPAAPPPAVPPGPASGVPARGARRWDAPKSSR